MPRGPSLWQSTRQIVGRALRETGQAMDRAALRLQSLAQTKHSYYDDPVLFQDHLSRHRQCLSLLSAGKPKVHKEVAFLAPCATLIGSVSVGPQSSIWYGAILRADECLNADSFRTDNDETVSADTWKLEDKSEKSRHHDRNNSHGGGIFIGEGTNIQDGCIITSRDNHCVIGNGVTVGHLAQIHSAVVQDCCLIGMGSIVQEGAIIESESFVAAGAVIARNQVVKSGELWVGNPARKLRDLTDQQREKLHYQSSEYILVANAHQRVMELGGNLSIEMIEQAAKLSTLEELDETARSEHACLTAGEINGRQNGIWLSVPAKLAPDDKNEDLEKSPRSQRKNVDNNANVE